MTTSTVRSCRRSGCRTSTCRPLAKPPERKPRALPHVLRLLIGLATSLIGNHIYLVTLAWVAVQTTTPANVGLILLAGAIPQAALLLIGGVFVTGSDPSRPS